MVQIRRKSKNRGFLQRLAFWTLAFWVVYYAVFLLRTQSVLSKEAVPPLLLGQRDPYSSLDGKVAHNAGKSPKNGVEGSRVAHSSQAGLARQQPMPPSSQLHLPNNSQLPQNQTPTHFQHPYQLNETAWTFPSPQIPVQRVVHDRSEILKRGACSVHSLEEARPCLKTHPAAFICETFTPGTTTCDPNTSILVLTNVTLIDMRGVVANPFRGIIYDVNGGCCLGASQLFHSRHWKTGDFITVKNESPALTVREKQLRLTQQYMDQVQTYHPSRPLALLAHYHDDSYFHFTIELMGRLLRQPMLKDWIREGTIDFYGGTMLKSFHRRYYNMLLCDQAGAMDVVNTHHYCFSSTQRLPEEVMHRGIYSMMLLPPVREYKIDRRTQAVYQEATKEACTARTSLSRPKVIVLQRGRTRRVTNLIPFLDLLRQVWPTVDFSLARESELGEMTLLEYAQTFCGAQAMIAGHGAGLSNMIWLRHDDFARAPPAVVQIMRPDQFGGNYYPDLAQSLGFKYCEIPAVENSTKTTGMGYSNTMIPNLCEAEKSIRPVLQSVLPEHVAPLPPVDCTQ